MEHPQYKKVEITLGQHRDGISLTEGRDGAHARLIISKEADEEYSSIILYNVVERTEEIRRLTPLEYSLAKFLLAEHAKGKNNVED